MWLVVDASVLVAESLRDGGRAMLTDPALDPFIPVEAWSETTHELRRRASVLIQRGVHSEDQAAAVFSEIRTTLNARLTIVPSEDFAARLPEATWCIPRDRQDAPVVALALTLGCGIWTNDRDFFGCGFAVWATEVLQRYLLR